MIPVTRGMWLVCWPTWCKHAGATNDWLQFQRASRDPQQLLNCISFKVFLVPHQSVPLGALCLLFLSSLHTPCSRMHHFGPVLFVAADSEERAVRWELPGVALYVSGGFKPCCCTVHHSDSLWLHCSIASLKTCGRLEGWWRSLAYLQTSFFWLLPSAGILAQKVYTKNFHLLFSWPQSQCAG